MPRNWSDFRRIFAIQPISNGKKTTQPCLPIVDDIIMWNKFLGLLTKCKMKSIHNRMNEIEFKSIFKVHYYFWLSWSAWRGSHTHLAEHLCWIFVLLKKTGLKPLVEKTNKQNTKGRSESQEINETQMMRSFGNKNWIHSSFNQILSVFIGFCESSKSYSSQYYRHNRDLSFNLI